MPAIGSKGINGRREGLNTVRLIDLGLPNEARARAAEQAYRRCYVQGVAETLRQLKSGVSADCLRGWLDVLMDWRYGLRIEPGSGYRSPPKPDGE